MSRVPASRPGSLDRRVEAVRRFNRFYTGRIGVLHERLLESPFSLTEARVLFEVAHRESTTATELGAELGLDGGYLSRILRRFRKRGLIVRKSSTTDRRRRVIKLARPGEEAFAHLDAESRDGIAAMLAGLSVEELERLVQAMKAIERLLDGTSTARPVPYILRPPRPGDMGWVVHRHGVLYAREYGWDERFEALVAGIVSRFIGDLDPRRERCWIAEREGENVGCVFLVTKSKRVAQLRLLLVEPEARGLGLGTRLVDECVRFARETGYRAIILWTNDVLHAARRIYERADFRLVHEEPHEEFGHGLIGQTWELDLREAWQ